MSKKEKLKPRVLECIDRLRKLVELDAPGVIIGASAWTTFTAVLAAYGAGAASTMVQGIRERALHQRAVCSHDDCVTYVDRPDLGICKQHLKILGLDEGTVEWVDGEPTCSFCGGPLNREKSCQRQCAGNGRD